MVIAMMAADDCTHRVRTVPIMRKKNEFQKVGSLKFAKKSLIILLAFGSSTTSKPVALSVPKPRKRNATPKRKSPTMRRFFMYISMMPMKNAG